MPAFNEAGNIARSISETVGTLRAFNNAFEVLVIDDGSSDETASVARESAKRFPEVRVIRYEGNRGKGFALAFGVEQSRGELVGFLDSDLDLHPRQFEPMIAKLKDASVAGVIGSKYHPHSVVVGYPAIRRLYSLGYYWLVRALFGLPLRDTQTGIRIFRRDAVLGSLKRTRTMGFAFDVELLVRLHDQGYIVVDAPVTLSFQRFAGRIQLNDVLAVAIDTVKIFGYTRLRLSRDKPALGDILALVEAQEPALLVPNFSELITQSRS